ncbi:MAG TPA: zinc ribbon domain-containing protein [Candidatus Acidoferrales bacterium]|nr:zinc ribbon domain-containing protein [Candidatus Acidoferrales bacterium]
MTTHTSTQTQTPEPIKTHSGDSRMLSAVNHEVRHENTATIASVSDQDFWVTRTYGAFHIPARPKNEPYGFVVVTPRNDAIDIGDSRRFTVQVSAREIAADIIQDLEDHGIVVCEAARPSPEEISAAIERRDAWYKQLVADADEMWARGHSYREISDMHRRAAKSLGLEREWAYVPQRSVDCPACGEKVRADVAMCKHCGATLDAERAAKYFPNGPRQKFAPGNNTVTANSSAASSKPHGS